MTIDKLQTAERERMQRSTAATQRVIRIIHYTVVQDPIGHAGEQPLDLFVAVLGIQGHAALMTIFTLGASGLVSNGSAVVEAGLGNERLIASCITTLAGRVIEHHDPTTGG